MVAQYRKTYCSVVNCKSGRSADKRKRRKLGLRQISLFRVPQDSNLRAKWSEILGQTLTDMDCVCELHFSTDAIDKFHDIFFPNGVVHRFEKTRYTLKPKALPMRQTQQSEVNRVDQVEGAPPTYIKLEILGSHSLYVEDNTENQTKPNRVDQINELLSLSDVNIGLQETVGSSANEVIDLTAADPICSGLENNSLQKNETSRIVEYPKKSSSKPNDNSIQNDIEVPIVQTKSQYDHCYHLKSYEVEGSCIEPSEKENISIPQEDSLSCNSMKKTLIPVKNAPALLSNNNDCISKKRPLSLIKNTSATSTNQIKKSHKKKKVEIENPEALQIQPFNLNTIREYFVKNPLPKSWTWIEKKKFDGIIFVQMNRFTQQIRCYVECKEDLSIEVSTFDKLKVNDMDTTVTSIDDILNLLMKVYNLRLCEGVLEGRSENCSIVLNEEERCKKKMPIDRCSNCRNEKKPKSNRSGDLKTKVNVSKTRELTQKLYQATRSCEYYREKCNNMQEMVQKLKKLCVTMQSTAKKTALDEAISQLPSVQQYVVKACFENANIDPRHRKYESNYASECFLLKEVSNAAYNHIRKQNLLPLPCENTLNTIVKGVSKT